MIQAIHYSLIGIDENRRKELKRLLAKDAGRVSHHTSFCAFSHGRLSSEVQNVIFFQPQEKGKLPDLLKEIRAKTPGDILILILNKEQANLGKQALQLGASDYLIFEDLTVDTLEKAIFLAVEKQKLRQSIEVSDNKFQALIQNNFDAFLIQSEDTTILNASKSIENLSGYKLGEVIGNKGTAFVHKDDIDQAMVLFQKVVNGEKKQVQFKERVKVSSGEYLWIEVKVSDCRHVPGIEALVSNIRNIDKEERTLRDLLTQKERLQRAMKIGRAGYWWFDMETYEITWSEELYLIYGLDSAMTKPDFQTFLSLVHPEDQKLFGTEYISKMKAEQQEEMEFRIMMPDGRIRWMRSKASLRLVVDGKAKIIEGITQDITRQKLAEEEKNAYLNDLKERVKEQKCLYDIQSLRRTISNIHQLLQEAVNILPSGWSEPELTRALISYNGEVFKSQDFLESPDKLECRLESEGKLQLEVFYIGEVSEGTDPFCAEERSLLQAVTDILHGSIKEIDAIHKLSASEEYLRSIFQNSLAAVMVTDDFGNIKDGNEAAAELLGVAYKDLIGKNITKVKTTKGITAQEAFDKFMKAGERKAEHALTDAIGKPKITLYQARHVAKDFNVGIFIDITDRKRMETELARNEEIYHILFDEAPLAKFVYDPVSLQIQRVNRKMTELYGYTEDQLLNMKVCELFDKNCESQVQRIKKSILKSKKYYHTAVHKNSQRQRIYVEIYGTQFIHDGEISHQITVRDITQEKAYRSEIKKLSLVASKTDNAVLVTDAEERIEWVNEGFVKLTGYQAGEVLGKKPNILQGPDTDEKDKAFIKNCVKAKQAFEATILNYTKDGKAYWVRMSVTPIFDKKGELVRFISIESDITERKKMELALEEREKRLFLFMENSPALSWLKDGEGKLLAANNKFLKATGRLKSDIGRKIEESSTGEIAPETRITDMEVLRFNKSVQITEKVPNSKGELRSYEVYKFPIASNGKLLLGGFALDVTDKLAYLAAIEKQNEKLREIAWIQSHVVRAPLARMLGLIELMNSGAVLPEEMDKVLCDLNNSATELDNIICNMIRSSSEIKAASNE